MQTFLGSVKKRIASQPPSRPTPEFLTPPKGVRKSRNSQQFIHTIPERNFSARVCARVRFSVHNIDVSPYSVLLAICMASSSVSKGIMVTTGPNISSILVRQLYGNPSTTVGSIYQPSACSPCILIGFPPQSILPPSCLASSIYDSIFS